MQPPAPRSVFGVLAGCDAANMVAVGTSQASHRASKQLVTDDVTEACIIVFTVNGQTQLDCPLVAGYSIFDLYCADSKTFFNTSVLGNKF